MLKSLPKMLKKAHRKKEMANQERNAGRTSMNLLPVKMNLILNPPIWLSKLGTIRSKIMTLKPIKQRLVKIKPIQINSLVLFGKLMMARKLVSVSQESTLLAGTVMKQILLELMTTRTMF